MNWQTQEMARFDAEGSDMRFGGALDTRDCKRCGCYVEDDQPGGLCKFCEEALEEALDD